jgi:ppGpp synthetase/RelA/SpoT-type nucleotidyltranferase
LANQTALFNNLKRSPDNQFYIDLTTLLNAKLDTVKDQLVESNDTEDILRLQGRAKELTELLKGLTRKPIKKQFDGAFV